MLKPIHIFLISLLPLFCSSQQCGNETGAVKSMKPSFGGISGFYSIAKGISDGLQSTPNQKTYNDLNNLIFGNGNVSTSDVAKDLIYNQIGAIIFWSIGFVFVLATLVLGIATAIWQCCFSCVPKKKKTPRSTIVGSIYFFSLLTIFAFILTGTILFNISTNDLVGSIDNGLDYTNEISTDIQNVLSNGTNQLNCAVNGSTNAIFGNMRSFLSTYGTNVIGKTEQEIGYTNLNDFNSSLFSTNVAAVSESRANLENILNGINDGDEKCRNGISAFKDQFSTIDVNLKIMNEISTSIGLTLRPITAQLDQIQDTINQNSDETTRQMNSTQDSITQSINNINVMVDDLQVDIKNALNSVKTAHNDIVTSSAYTTVKVLVRLFLNLFACIAMVLALYAMFSIGFAIRNKEVSEVPNFIPTLVLISFYTSIILAILMILLSSAAFVGGWVMSAMCVPTFEDPNYRLLNLVNEQTQSMVTNQTDIFNVGAAFTSCNNPSETIYNAINGSNIISADSINEELNLDYYRNQTNQQISNVDFAASPFPVDGLEQTINSLNESDGKIKNADISTCNNAEASASASTYLENVQIAVDSSKQLSNYITSFNGQVNNTQSIVIQQNDNTFDLGQANLTYAVNDLISNLQNNVFKCRPLVDIYNNGGYVVCQQYGKPIHGLWAAVGLAGIFMFLLSILLLLTYRWLKEEAEDKEQSFYAAEPLYGQVEEEDLRPTPAKKSKKAKQSKNPDIKKNDDDNIWGTPYSESDLFAKPAISTSGGLIPRIYPENTTPPRLDSASAPLGLAGAVRVLPRTAPTNDVVGGLPRHYDNYEPEYGTGSVGKGLRRM